ncbi:major facilitator superfamily domain-containing protein [Xylariaceae sp. FL0255]|nr:major facilitator superfamily domain-containing protein [Xylariaceae sp. FL0255]
MADNMTEADEKGQSPTPQNGEPSYPPKDRGVAAWLFLIGASIVEVTAWGFPYCYGVFREYFFNNEPFKGQSIVSTGGVLANGVLQITVPIVIYTCNIFPNQRKNAMWLGCLLCTVSPIAAAFTTSASALVVLLGPLYGIGAGLLFAPSMHFLDDWFEERKSFAYGIICGAGAAGGAGFPPAYTVALNKYGYKATLIGFGLITFVVTALGLLLVKSRTPPEKAIKPTWQDVDFVRKPLFLVFLASTLVQGIAHYGPSAYLPSIGVEFGLSNTQGALLVSLLNLAQAIGQPLQGAIADSNASFYVPLLISTIGGGGSSLLIWAFARKLYSLVIFSLVFGATAGGYAVLRPRFARAVLGTDGKALPEADSSENLDETIARHRNKSMLIFGIFTAARGAAIIASGFIDVTLVRNEYTSLAGYGLGPRWRDLIIFTGVVMTSASFGVFGRWIPHALKW